jgi:hypothetical protein
MSRRVCAITSVLLVLATASAIAQTPGQSVTPEKTIDPPAPATGLPALRSFQIRQDTHAEREAFLKQRQLELDQKKVQEVRPLPQQTILPSSPQQQR